MMKEKLLAALRKRRAPHDQSIYEAIVKGALGGVASGPGPWSIEWIAEQLFEECKPEPPKRTRTPKTPPKGGSSKVDPKAKPNKGRPFDLY